MLLTDPLNKGVSTVLEQCHDDLGKGGFTIFQGVNVRRQVGVLQQSVQQRDIPRPTFVWVGSTLEKLTDDGGAKASRGLFQGCVVR
jgi:hypothetical protein